ncbi:hypothetical protein DPX39_110066300 [Trypanosoma brucei equiperdum]|uniref:Transmembrane protein n=1 Tax=Trypanosoma brucei equiperdum TaxID=630700 RepID=A0A3L6KUT6_9TRYP|nr:hypothetical protein DPX39_110066900 [Trypanosoma brucei equiperdum]RHW67808.1 hypothetical protein DPX39_110066600 [Trypanosoma brucei equiperdum]RHW68159.1 hypothetical protein DPX39_110066300 [Trypanosoma brucei equiperdum]
MDGLYFTAKAQFHQLATHISLYHEDASPTYRTLGEACLQLAGLRPDRFTFWNVPNMSGYFNKALPLDIHGGYVLVDEAAVKAAAGTYGVLRYAYLAAAVRARAGGRWRYDFTTMNAALCMGVASGFAVLSVGRRRWPLMRRRPVGAIAVGVTTCFVAVVATRLLLRAMGAGITHARNSNRRALEKLRCVDCYDDVARYTEQRKEEVEAQRVPQPQPGMPPLPEASLRQFERLSALQVQLLESNLCEIRLAKRRANSQLCDVHRGLRDDEQYAVSAGLPIQSADVALARERARQLPSGG